MPPTQTLAASTCRTSAGKNTAGRALDARVAGQRGRDRQVGAAEQRGAPRALRRGGASAARCARRTLDAVERRRSARAASAGAEEQHRAEQQPVDRARAPHLAEAAFERVFEDRAFQRAPQRDAGGARALQQDAEHARRRRPSTTATASSRPHPSRRTRARPPSSGGSAPAHRARAPAARRPRRNASPPMHQRDRQVVEDAHDAERDGRDLAALVAADQPGDGELRCRARRDRC